MEEIKSISLDRPTVHDAASKHGLTVEGSSVPEHEPVFRIYKGARMIFVGTEAAAHIFLETYRPYRPDLRAA